MELSLRQQLPALSEKKISIRYRADDDLYQPGRLPVYLRTMAHCFAKRDGQFISLVPTTAWPQG